MDYKILNYPDIDEIEKEIKRRLDLGWKLKDGLIVSKYGLFQVMIKESIDDEKPKFPIYDIGG